MKQAHMRRIVTLTSHTADDQFCGPKFRALKSVCQKSNKGSGLPRLGFHMRQGQRRGRGEEERGGRGRGGSGNTLPLPALAPGPFGSSALPRMDTDHWANIVIMSVVITSLR